MFLRDGAGGQTSLICSFKAMDARLMGAEGHRFRLKVRQYKMSNEWIKEATKICACQCFSLAVNKENGNNPLKWMCFYFLRALEPWAQCVVSQKVEFGVVNIFLLTCVLAGGRAGNSFYSGKQLVQSTGERFCCIINVS